ncbi:MAG: MFS transporter [Chloroflexota bacterium]
MSPGRFSPFLLLCLTGLFAIFSSTVAKTPALPLFAAALGASEADIGFIAAASTVVGILVSLPAGALSDIYGRRRVLLLAALVFASAPPLYLLVHEPWQLVAVRIYHGFATAIFGPVALALVADLFERGRGASMGWYSSATLAGRAAAPVIGGAALTLASYEAVYVASAVGGIAALVLATRLPNKPPTVASASSAVTMRARRAGLAVLLRSRPVMATSAAEAAQYFSYGAIETFLPLYALTVGGLESWQIGLIFGVQVLTTTLSKPAMGRASDSLGRRPLIATGLAISAAASAALTLSPSFANLLVAGLAYGLGLAVVTTSTSAFVSEQASTGNYGAALGVLSSVMDVGHASGPIVAGLLVVQFGYASTFTVIAALLLSAAAAFLALVPSATKRAEVP